MAIPEGWNTREEADKSRLKKFGIQDSGTARENFLKRFGLRGQRKQSSVPSILGASASRGVFGSGGFGGSFGSPQITSPSMEWNKSGGPAKIAGEQRARAGADVVPSFLFSDAPSLQDFLSQAMNSANISGVTGAYDARIADAEKRKAEALVALQNGSEDLARRLEGSRGEVDARYAQAIQQMQQGSQQSQAALANQAESTNAAQAQLWANLGLDAGDNSRAVGDQSFASGQLASESQAAQTAAMQNQLAQYALGTANAGAARGRGLEDQASSRRSFDTNIAELLDARATAEQEARMQAQQTGQQAFQNAYGQWSDQRDFAYGEWKRQQENARDDARWMLEQEMAQQGQVPELSPYQRYMQSQAQAGVSGGKANEWFKRANQYDPKALPNQQGSFQELWGAGSPQAQAAVWQLLKDMGLL